MFDCLLDRLLDPISVRVVPDGDRRHSLVEADDKSIHGDPNCDHSESANRQVRETERQDEPIGRHEQTKADGLNLIMREVHELERYLNDEPSREQPGGCELQASQLSNAPERDDDDDHRHARRHNEEPHARGR